MEIVKGMVFRIESGKLAEHLRKRATHHDSRAEEKSAVIPSLKTAIDTMKGPSAAAVSNSKHASNYGFRGDDQIEALESDIVMHRGKAMTFRTMADLLIPDVAYDLNEADLTRAELVR